MSLPSFPQSETVPSREEVINQIISSIAMEELGLSHIINAEGEKIQYALGTIPGISGPEGPLTMDQLLELNKSVRSTLDSTMMNQFFLKDKLDNALSAAILQGPTGPTGPAGAVEAAGIQVILNNTAATELDILSGAFVPFNQVVNNSSTDITYDPSTGVFTINTSELNNMIMINWWVFVEGRDGDEPVTLSLNASGASYLTATPWLQTQLSGSTLIVVGEGVDSIQVSLTNVTGNTISLTDVATQAQINIVGFRSV